MSESRSAVSMPRVLMLPTRKRPTEPWRVASRTESESRAYRACVSYPHHIPVRVSAAERTQLVAAARAAGMSLSRYIVQAITQNRYPPTIEERDELTALRVQLERVGINLNQVARRLNAAAQGKMSAPALSEVRATARAIRELSREIGRRLL